MFEFNKMVTALRKIITSYPPEIIPEAIHSFLREVPTVADSITEPTRQQQFNWLLCIQLWLTIKKCCEQYDHDELFPPIPREALSPATPAPVAPVRPSSVPPPEISPSSPALSSRSDPGSPLQDLSASSTSASSSLSSDLPVSDSDSTTSPLGALVNYSRARIASAWSSLFSHPMTEKIKAHAIRDLKQFLFCSTTAALMRQALQESPKYSHLVASNARIEEDIRYTSPKDARKWKRYTQALRKDITRMFGHGMRPNSFPPTDAAGNILCSDARVVLFFLRALGGCDMLELCAPLKILLVKHLPLLQDSSDEQEEYKERELEKARERELDRQEEKYGLNFSGLRTELDKSLPGEDEKRINLIYDLFSDFCEDLYSACGIRLSTLKCSSLRAKDFVGHGEQVYITFSGDCYRYAEDQKDASGNVIGIDVFDFPYPLLRLTIHCEIFLTGEMSVRAVSHPIVYQIYDPVLFSKLERCGFLTSDSRTDTHSYMFTRVDRCDSPQQFFSEYAEIIFPKSLSVQAGPTPR